MCAILDANVAHEVFNRRNDAGQAFFNWIVSGNNRLVIGGKNRQELGRRDEWISQLIQSGRIRQVDDIEVENVANKLKSSQSCRSDDEHIIALAQLSGARLLYSNDKHLGDDFKDKKLINPAGKVYSTQITNQYDNSKFDEAKRRLLNRNLCR